MVGGSHQSCVFGRQTTRQSRETFVTSVESFCPLPLTKTIPDRWPGQRRGQGAPVWAAALGSYVALECVQAQAALLVDLPAWDATATSPGPRLVAASHRDQLPAWSIDSTDEPWKVCHYMASSVVVLSCAKSSGPQAGCQWAGQTVQSCTVCNSEGCIGFEEEMNALPRSGKLHDEVVQTESNVVRLKASLKGKWEPIISSL